MKKMNRLVWGLMIVCSVNASEFKYLESTRNLTTEEKELYLKRSEFYGDFFVPLAKRRLNSGSPLYLIHRMDGDFGKCTACHETKPSKALYAGIQIPMIPKWMPTDIRSSHPQAKGICTICHVVQPDKDEIHEFSLQEVKPTIFKPKL